MKRLILISILVGLLATPVLAGSTFRFITQAEVLGFSEITDYTNDPDGDALYQGAYTTTAGYGPTLPAGSVGLVARAVGAYAGGVEANIEWIGLGATGIDLTGYTDYSVTINNDDDDIWKYKLFVDDGIYASRAESGSWTSIGSTSTGTLTLPISGYTTGSRVGLMIGSDTRENTVHTSILIPEPATVVLLGLSSLSLILRRRR